MKRRKPKRRPWMVCYQSEMWAIGGTRPAPDRLGSGWAFPVIPNQLSTCTTPPDRLTAVSWCLTLQGLRAPSRTGLHVGADYY